MKKIIYQDRKILVTEKPAGIIVESFAKKINNKIEELTNLPRHGLVHRIDKDTSGLLLFAKEKATLENLQKQFQQREIRKKYIALVWRPMKKTEGLVETVMRRSKNDRRKHQSYPLEESGRKAISRYQVLENFENYSLIEISPTTGRKHQIRSQFAYLGHPLVGDKLYGFKDQVDPPKIKRHFLHGNFLEIKIDEKRKRFISELPKDLKEIIKTIQCL